MNELTNPEVNSSIPTGQAVAEQPPPQHIMYNYKGGRRKAEGGRLKAED
jgi:hypothetical protein